MKKRPNFSESRRVLVLCAWTLAISVVGAGCARDEAKAPESVFKFDASVPAEQKSRISKDLERLQTLDIMDLELKNEDGLDLVQDTVRLMGLAKMASAELTVWLTERVHYVIGQDFALSSKTLFMAPRRGFSYENSSEIPSIEEAPVPVSNPDPQPAASPAPVRTATVVMANIGSALYLAGKMNDFLIGIKVAGDDVPLTSPRTGIIQVGPGLFHPSLEINPGEPGALANSLERLGIFFHEARHSDGHGKSLGFLHAVCPTGDYQGIHACDRNLNGPYTTGARMTQILAENCRRRGKCLPKETERLRILYLDSYSRMIPETLDARSQSDLNTVQAKITACERAGAANETCSNLDRLRAQMTSLKASARITPSAEWDAAPEGARR